MFDSTNENASRPGEAHRESTDNPNISTAERIGKKKSQPIVDLLAHYVVLGRPDARGTRQPGGGPYSEGKPLDRAALVNHASGGTAHGIYPIKPGESVCGLGCLDFDSHKGETPWSEMADAARKVSIEAQRRGLIARPFRSIGGKGIHLHFAWAAKQDARSVRVLLRQILGECAYKDGAGGVKVGEVEVFPKQDRVALGGYGNYFFLPGAGLSEPLDPMTFEGLGKGTAAGYTLKYSAPVPIVAPEPPRVSSNTDVDLAVVASAVAAIPNDGVDYEKWFRIVAAIHACDCGEEGHEIAETWSERSDKHRQGWFEHTWSHLDEKRDNGAAFGTLSHHARANGWIDPERQAAIDAFDAINIEASIAWVQEYEKARATSTVPRVSDLPFFIRNAKGNVKPLLSNVIKALSNPYTSGGVQLGRDTFKDEVMIAYKRGQWRPITDADLILFRERFETMQDGMVGVGREMMRDAVAHLAEFHQFDSAQLWLTDLKWDRVARVERLMSKYFGAEESQYSRAVSRYFMTALAGRVMSPGIQADMALILVGAQGVGKSTGLQCLSPSPECFAEISLTSKDDDLARVLRGVLIAEIGELKGLMSREIEHTKSLITRRFEKWVPKFKEFSTSYARRSIFAGTTNSDEFLDDSTGERRMLPIWVGITHNVERDDLARDRDQLWAEGREMFKFARDLGGSGVDWQPAERLARLEHDKFSVVDGWTDFFVSWLKRRLEPDKQGDKPKEFTPFTSTEAIQGAVSIPSGQINLTHKKRASSILTRLDYEQNRLREDGGRVRRWTVKR